MDSDLSERALAELELTDGIIALEPTPPRWEFWVSVAAAASAILVIGAMLLTRAAELRTDWVPGHDCQWIKPRRSINCCFALR